MLNPPSPESAPPAPLSGAVPWGQAMTTIGERSGIDHFAHAPGKPAPIAKTMAYGSGTPAANGHIVSQLYRLRRGFAYTRAGVIQPPIPQFKGLYLYTQAAGHIPTAANPTLRAIVPPAFRQTMTPTRVRWTTSNIPNVVTP